MVVFCSISVTFPMLKKKFKWKADTTLTLQIPITSKLNQSVILKQYNKIDIVYWLAFKFPANIPERRRTRNESRYEGGKTKHEYVRL